MIFKKGAKRRRQPEAFKIKVQFFLMTVTEGEILQSRNSLSASEVNFLEFLPGQIADITPMVMMPDQVIMPQHDPAVLGNQKVRFDGIAALFDGLIKCEECVFRKFRSEE